MFENLVMLAGLGGALLPLIIHLLNRARYRSVDWGAMMFLDVPRHDRREHVGRLREWTLLGVRMAIVALLAIALARPVAGALAARTAAAGDTRVAVAIVVDCSASMSHADAGGPPRIDQARAAVLRILSTLRPGDQVCLQPSLGAVPAAFTGDLQAVANRANELKPAGGASDLPAALLRAADALARQDASSRRLYVVCDRQASNWSRMDDALAAQVRDRVNAARAGFVVISVGSDDAENIGIESLELINPPAVAGCNAEAEISVRNFGSTPRLGLPVSLRLAGREVFTTTINLPARQAQKIVCPVTFATAGSQVLSAEVLSGAGDADDRRETIIDVAGPVRTLIVRGGDELSSPDFVRAALAPFHSARQAGADVADVETVIADEWDEQSLDRYRVLVLDDVPALSAAQARAVEQFVYGGGGLLLAPGPRSKIDQYNRLLYREDAGLLPALLQTPVKPPQPLHVEPSTIDLAHPLMRFLGSHVPAVTLPGVITQYFPTTGRIASAAVLASLSSGDPLLIESSFGRGRIVLATCSLGAEWSSLPRTNLYLPLLQSSVRYLAGGAAPTHNRAVGQELVATIPDAAAPVARATVQRPDGSSDSADVNSLDEGVEVRYAGTNVPGVYTIRIGAGDAQRTARFAVAPSAEESDLTPLDPHRWEQLQQQLAFTRASDARTLATQLSSARETGQFWLAALFCVLGLIVVELALTRAWLGEER